MRVLLIEDSRVLSSSIQSMFASDNRICDIAETAEDGIRSCEVCEYDAIIVDIMLPDADGINTVKIIRQNGIKTPILILSALDSVDVKIRGLSSGADDYLVKPFNKAELTTRINVLVRRKYNKDTSNDRTGRLSLDFQTHRVTIDNEVIHLTDKEYAILELLFLRKGATLSKEMFLNHLYGGMDEPEMKIIDVFICKLRSKLAKRLGPVVYISTVWGRGYVLRDIPVPDSLKSIEEKTTESYSQRIPNHVGFEKESANSTEDEQYSDKMPKYANR